MRCTSDQPVTLNSKMGAKKSMNKATFVTTHEDSHVKIRVLSLVRLIRRGGNGEEGEKLGTKLLDESLLMSSRSPVPRCFGGLFNDRSCFKRRK